MSSPLDFTGRVALITGGSRGIGRGIAEAFLAAGADVAVCGRKEPDELANAGGKSAIFVSADVRDPEQVEKMVDEVVERLGRLDVLVNNAGGAPFAEAATVSPRFSEKVIQLNLTAALHCAQQANRVMQGQDSGGSIINVASVSGLRPSHRGLRRRKSGADQPQRNVGHRMGPQGPRECYLGQHDPDRASPPSLRGR